MAKKRTRKRTKSKKPTRSKTRKKTTITKPAIKSLRERLFGLFSIKRLIYFTFILITFSGLTYWYIFKNFPSPNKLATINAAQTTKIYDRNNSLLFDIFVDKDRTVVPLSQIPTHVQQATIAIEDKDFYKHIGINPVGGIIRALRETVFKKQLQGGSTITQQLVKTVLLTPERTVQRKIKEMILALIVEFRYSKKEILEMYLNNVPYGGTAWGIEAAARRYFNKSVSELDLAEATLLAGLPVAPTYYSLHGENPERSKSRQQAVLTRMVEDGYITQEEADQASMQKLEITKPETDIRAPHFVMYVKQQLVDKYGEKLVEQGGLRVKTTLDLNLQEFVQETVASEVAKLERYDVTNGAALVTRPYTGEILAMSGSIDYFATPSGTFNVTTAMRQPGSSIKPINYAIGLENRIVTPASVFNDVPTCFIGGPKAYCPRNYDGQFHGPTQLRFTLGNSYNIPAVKMLKLNGVETMIASAAAFGINTFTDPSRYGLSLTLGGGEVPMTEMATAFGVFANGGVRKDLVSILKVEDGNGKAIYEYEDANLDTDTPSSLLINGPRVISPETAFLISHILLDQHARSATFGTSALQVREHPSISVKTGTTDDLRDNWTIGFTPDIVVTTWVGNNDNSPMNPYLTSGITGAAPIWNAIMSHFFEGKQETPPKKPDGIVGLEVCAISGKLPPDDDSCPKRFEFFITNTQPTEKEQLKTPVPIDTTTGKLARPDQTENVEVHERLVVWDPFGPYCIDCNHEDEPYQAVR